MMINIQWRIIKKIWEDRFWNRLQLDVIIRQKWNIACKKHEPYTPALNTDIKLIFSFQYNSPYSVRMYMIKNVVKIPIRCPIRWLEFLFNCLQNWPWWINKIKSNSYTT